MTIVTLAMSSLSVLALFLATFALRAALRSSDRSLSRRLTALSEQLSELTESHEILTAQFRNIRSRLNMAKAREAKANGATRSDPATPGTDPEAEKDRWTREMNLKIASGEVRIPGRR